MVKTRKWVGICLTALLGLWLVKSGLSQSGSQLETDASPQIFYSPVAPAGPVPPGSIWILATNVWSGTNYIQAAKTIITPTAAGTAIVSSLIITNYIATTNTAVVLSNGWFKLALPSAAVPSGITNGATTNIWVTPLGTVPNP